MKIERLIGILSILLQCDRVTAPELAEKFEVSRRTINRDIEELNRAGIPICTMQGQNGGIFIMENYKMDRTVLTRKEMAEILTGLRSLDSVSGSNWYGRLMEKLQVGASDFMRGNGSVLIDLSAWSKEASAGQLETVRAAIDGRRYLEFAYYAPEGMSRRRIEPYYLIFRWAGWYVWGWCTLREDFRLFKLNRMADIRLAEADFAARVAPLPDTSNTRVFPGGINLKALFQPQCKWRLVEEFGPRCFEEQEDGRLLFQREYTNRAYLVSWLLAFGDQAEVLEPADIREEIREVASRMADMYMI